MALDALPPCCLSPHSQRLAISKVHSALCPCQQRSTGKRSHHLQATSVIVSSACSDSHADGFDQKRCRLRRQEHRGHSETQCIKGCRIWDHFYYAVMNIDEDGPFFLCSDKHWWGWDLRILSRHVHFSLRLLHRAADNAYCCNYSVVNWAQELWHLQCWSNHKSSTLTAASAKCNCMELSCLIPGFLWAAR